MRGFVLASAFLATLVAQGCAGPIPTERPPAEARTIPWTGQMPHCDDPAVSARIAKHFRQREDRYWYTGLEIQAIDHIRPVALRPWGRDIVPRRYCTGRAQMSDGRHRRIHYSIIEDGGMIGMSWGVEWCVTGLDRHNGFAPWCKMALP